MNKTDLINDVAEVIGTKKGAQEAVERVLASIVDSLKNKEAVTLVGFGTFSVKERPARKGRNPKTGEEITIDAKSVVKFTPGKKMKEAVN